MIMVIGDIHLKINNLSQGKKLIAWLSEAVSIYKPNLVINLGDVFDGHAVIRAEVVGEYRAFVDCVLSQGAKYIHILGNHEMFAPSDATYHALQAFKGIHPNFLVIDSPVKIDNLYFVPYVYNLKNFPGIDDFREHPTFSYEKVLNPTLFCHQTFAGTDFGGYIPHDAIDAETLPYDQIISGHVHLRQTFGKVFYPGSPFAQNAKDIDQIKGIHLIDENITFIESPLPRWKSSSLEEVLSLEESTDHHVIRLSGTKAEMTKILSSPRVEEARTRLSLRIDIAYTDAEKVLDKIETPTPEITINNYIDQIYKGDVDRQLLKMTAKKYLQKVNA